MATNARQNNATVLNGAGAFARAIANTDQLTWSGITGTNATVLMGGAIDVSNSVSGGISVLSGQTVAVTINHSSQVALSLGALGVDMSAAGADLTLGPTAVVFIPVTQSWNVASGRTLVVSGTMTGSGALTKAGSGNLFLTGSGNNNNGTFTVNAGNVLVANYNSGTPNQLGSVGTIALGTSGGIQYCGNTAYSSSSNITGSGSAGVVVRNTSATGFTFNAGALVAGTYTGAFTMYADGNEGGVTAQTVTFNDAGWTGMQYAFLNNGSATGLTQTFKHAGTTTATMAGPLYLQTAAANQVAVLQASSTGNIVWNGSVAVLGNSGGTMTLEFNNSSSGTTTFGGAIADNAYTLNVRKSGTGTTTFSGANSFDGTVQVTAGTLNANSATALGAASSTAAISVTSGATLSLGAALNYSSPGRTTTINGTGVSTGGALLHAFAGTANIGAISLGASAYIRGTASGTSTLSSSIANGGFALTAGAAPGNTLTLTGVISGAGSLIAGNSSLDTGTVALTVANNYSGGTTIRAGTVVAGNADALGNSGTVTLNDASTGSANTALLLNSVIFNRAVVVANQGSGTTTLGANGSVAFPVFATSVTINKDIIFDGGTNTDRLTIFGVVSGTGNVTIAGTGRVVFDGNIKIYAGTTTVNNGSILQLGIGASTGTSFLPDNQGVIVNGTLRLAKGANSQTIGTLTGSGTVNQFVSGAATLILGNDNGSGTFSGVLSNTSGTLALTKTGSGIQTLSGANTYTGGTNIGAGTLKCNHVNALNTTGTVTLTSSSATLQTATSGQVNQNGKLEVGALNNAAGGTIKIGG